MDLNNPALQAPLPCSSLVEFVKKINRGNLYGEIDFGAPMGREIW